MKFSEIRELRKVEASLDRAIDRASEKLSPGDAPRRFADALRSGRTIARSPLWHDFLRFARPVNEAKHHIEAEREWLERAAEREIIGAVQKLKGKRK